MAVATGQFTIIDYNDALTLTGYIGSNKAKTQMFNPDNNSYNPDWSTGNLVLTPSLFKLGTASDIITDAAVQSIDWYDVTNGTETLITANASYAIGASKPKALTVKTNVLAGLPGKDFMCKIVYRDPSTNLDLIYKMSISFSRVVNGGGIADAVAWCPDGNVFKNGTVASLKAQCDLWRGSVIDSTLVGYQWYQQDSSVTTDQGGGIGWRKLIDAANVVTGTTSNILVIYPSAVNVYGVFKCIAKDTDSGSNTYNQFFVDTVTIADQSDPLQVTITSTGGDVFKNGVGSTTLTAKVYQAGNEIDTAGTKYTYKWFKYDKDGTLVANFGGTGINFKAGKTLAVGDADVDIKATFSVEVN